MIILLFTVEKREKNLKCYTQNSSAFQFFFFKIYFKFNKVDVEFADTAVPIMMIGYELTFNSEMIPFELRGFKRTEYSWAILNGNLVLEHVWLNIQGKSPSCSVRPPLCRL